MSRSQISNNTRIGLIAVALAGGIKMASSAAFAVEALPQSYQLAAADKAGKANAARLKLAQKQLAPRPPKASVVKARAATPPSPVPTPTTMAGCRARNS